ncbi:MAG: galactose mutarotase [Treponema sp.]|nr:galactose mutarotase [Treponema sp.]
MNITKQRFGVLSDGTEVSLFTVKNDNMSFSCTDYGCTLTSIVLNNKKSVKTDVLLGFSTLEGYLNTKYCFGTVVGRFANRIGTASFTLNGKKYELDKNDGPNTLHGGFFGYDKIMWDAEIIESEEQCGVKFSRLSPDGEQGFPGNVKLEITYLLDTKNNLTCYYTAETDAPTPINITNHAYFNLAGNGSVKDHTVKMNSDYILEVSPVLIPTGKLLEVKGTPFDFTSEKKIGEELAKVGAGYDHCYVTTAYGKDKKCGVPLEDGPLVDFAVVKDSKTGNEMDVLTNMEGCQFYTGNYIKGLIGKNGVVYQNHDAFCLETQCFPDTPNKPDFPTCILEPGQKMKAKTIYAFKTTE